MGVVVPPAAHAHILLFCHLRCAEGAVGGIIVGKQREGAVGFGLVAVDMEKAVLVVVLADHEVGEGNLSVVDVFRLRCRKEKVA